MLLFKLFFFQLKCRIPDLIPRENAEALSSLRFQTPAAILVSTLVPVMPLLSGDATGVYLNIFNLSQVSQGCSGDCAHCDRLGL